MLEKFKQTKAALESHEQDAGRLANMTSNEVFF